MLKVTKVWPKKFISGKLLGFADVQMSLDGGDTGHMIWKGFKLFQSKDGGVQIGLPSKKDDKGELDENGKIIYRPIITVAKEESGGPATELMEHLRQEIENAYFALQSTPKDTNNSNKSAGGIDDDLPF